MHNNFTKLLKRSSTVAKATSLFVFFMVLLIINQTALASGKPVGKHRLFLIPAAAYFFNSTYWDRAGVYRTYNNDLHFGSKILSINSEYGFSRRVSLMASIPFIINSASQTGFSSSVAGFGDAELGMRYYLANINYNVYFSVQGTLVVPLYSSDPVKRLGYDKLGTELKFIGAGDFAIAAKKFYWEVNIGGRQFLGDVGPFQAKGSASLSYSINKKNQLSLAETSLYSYSSAKTLLNVSNPLDVANTKDFNFNQITGSYSYSIKRNKSLFLSYSKFLSGVNTGAGTTISIGYVYKY